MASENLLLAGLNPEQRAAVTAPDGHALVVAGAGSGKTRVLIHRIAWLITERQVPAHAVLAVTFTNKAAKEMRHRLAGMLPDTIYNLWMGTFHSLAHRLLRLHWQEAGLKRDFQVADADDQRRWVKRVMGEQGWDDDTVPVREAVAWINRRKDDGLRPQSITPRDGREARLRQVYEIYSERLEKAGILDFGELLLRALELLQSRPALLQHYQDRFRHVLVDEFQDTNKVQYEWLKTLVGSVGYLFAVGDQDQSIYAFRGARATNMAAVLDDFPDVHEARLERNYRSTKPILDVANALIAKNTHRAPKTLWTERASGASVKVFSAHSETDEADFVVDRIRQRDRLHAFADHAILYRTNAQSRAFEEALLRARIPYRIYGGLRFFERAEIKDVMAYVRLLVNPNDDEAFERAISTPTRGVGAKTIEEIRRRAAGQRSLWSQVTSQVQPSPTRPYKNAQSFCVWLCRLQERLDDEPLSTVLADLIDESGLRAHHEKASRTERNSRADNLDELLSVVVRFQAPTTDGPASNAATIRSGAQVAVDFVAHTVLEAGQEGVGAAGDAVQLMTLHSAKGLEFPVVFLVGCEEGLLPSARSTQSSADLEEERRLAYVGITRAQQLLVLLHAEQRLLYGRHTLCEPSRFIDEIPASLLSWIRPQSAQKAVQKAAKKETPRTAPRTATSSRCATSANPKRPHTPPYSLDDRPIAMRPGQMVKHDRHGKGVVVSLSGTPPDQRVFVAFKGAGGRWIALATEQLHQVQGSGF